MPKMAEIRTQSIFRDATNPSYTAFSPVLAAPLATNRSGALGADGRPVFVRTYERRHAAAEAPRIGNSVGLVLPKESLARLGVALGDSVFLTESPDGYRLTPYDPDVERELAAASLVVKKRRAVLRELSK
jgi:putative addiction module antidote